MTKSYTPEAAAVAEWQAVAEEINQAVEANRAEIAAKQELLNELQKELGALRTRSHRLLEQRDQHGRNRPQPAVYEQKGTSVVTGEYPRLWSQRQARGEVIHD